MFVNIRFITKNMSMNKAYKNIVLNFYQLPLTECAIYFDDILKLVNLLTKLHRVGALVSGYKLIKKKN